MWGRSFRSIHRAEVSSSGGCAQSQSWKLWDCYKEIILPAWSRISEARGLGQWPPSPQYAGIYHNSGTKETLFRRYFVESRQDIDLRWHDILIISGAPSLVGRQYTTLATLARYTRIFRLFEWFIQTVFPDKPGFDS